MMDLKQLREDALNEVNAEQREAKIESFKRSVKNIMNAIAANVTEISNLKEKNTELKLKLEKLDVEPIENLEL